MPFRNSLQRNKQDGNKDHKPSKTNETNWKQPKSAMGMEDFFSVGKSFPHEGNCIRRDTAALQRKLSSQFNPVARNECTFLFRSFVCVQAWIPAEETKQRHSEKQNFLASLLDIGIWAIAMITPVFADRVQAYLPLLCRNCQHFAALWRGCRIEWLPEALLRHVGSNTHGQGQQQQQKSDNRDDQICTSEQAFRRLVICICSLSSTRQWLWLWSTCMHACPMLGCWTTCQLWCFKNGWFQSLHLQQSFGRWIDSNSTIDPRFDTLARVSAVVCFFVYVATAWNPIHLSFTQKFDAPFGKLHQSMVQTERLKMIRQ